MLLFYFQQTIIVKPPPEALLKELPRYSTRRTLQAMEEGTLFYKLGQEAAYKQYINQFTNNPHALSKVQANEERVKRTHMSHKFSLTDVSTFRWMGMYYYLSIFGHIWRNVEFLGLFFFSIYPYKTLYFISQTCNCLDWCQSSENVNRANYTLIWPNHK